MKREIGILLGPIVFLVLIFLPISPDPNYLPAQYTAAVTALMIIWWVTEAIPIQATALIPVVLFPLMGVLKISDATIPYANEIIFLFMGGFIIAVSMQRWGLHRRIALHIINVVGGGPRRIILGFMIASAFLSMWISNTATAMMMIPIGIAIIATVLPDKDIKLNEMGVIERDFSECIVLAIAYAASIGGVATIIGTPPNGIFVAQLQALFPNAPTIDFFTWMKFGVPLAALFIPLAWLWLTYGAYRNLPKSISNSSNIIRSEIENLGPMNQGEKWTLIVFVVTAFAWIFRTTKQLGDFVIPGLDQIFPGINDASIAIAGALLLFLLPVDWKNGIYTMDWEWARKIPWGILILFGGGICLSVAFIKSGLADIIVSHFSALHHLPVIAIVLIIGILVSLLTEVTSNTAMASLMMPIMAVTSVSMFIDPFYLMMTAAIAASFAFMLPVATPPNAVAYSSGYVTMRDMIRSGWVLNFLGIALWTIFLFTIVAWVLGLSPELPSWAVNILPPG